MPPVVASPLNPVRETWLGLPPRRPRTERRNVRPSQGRPSGVVGPPTSWYQRRCRPLVGLGVASEAPAPNVAAWVTTQEKTLSLKKLGQRQAALLAKSTSMMDELEALGTGEGDRQRAKRLSKGIQKIHDEIDDINDQKKSAQLAEVQIDAGNVVSGTAFDRDPLRDPKDRTPVFTGNDPWDGNDSPALRHTSPEEAKSRALSAVELASGMSEGSREKATEILEKQDPTSVIARYALLTSDPDYVSAFAQSIKSPNPLLTNEEIKAVRRANEFARAMSLTNTEGGFLVPFQLDPAVIQTDALGVSDIRRISKNVVATGDVWNGVSSGAVSWSWDAEATEVSDDATTFAQPTVVIHTARGFVPISIEAFMDEANVTEAIGQLLADGRNDLEGTALATGSGSSQPFGIVTALAGGASETTSATTDVFAIADVNALWDALPARYQTNATWLANPIIYNEIRGFGAAGSPAPFITELKDELLIKRPMAVSSYVDATYGSGDNQILVVGDFQNYVLADRIGMQVELVPHLFATANNRPSGQRGLFAFYRMGADSVLDGAFSVLNVT